MTLALRRRTLVVAAVLAFLPTSAPAWEAATTHAGLTEQAGLGSALHERLVQGFGLERGLYEVLEVPPADAPALLALLALFSPGQGFSPDDRGRQSALAWLVAGSAIADSPGAHFANHFYDPRGRHGLSDDTLRGALVSVRLWLVGTLSGGRLPRSGGSALAWLDHADNPMNLSGFWSQYDKAVLARTPGERSRHLAGALTCAGALLHVLEDMGSPSHVRNDLAAHADPLSELPGDRGSRFERLAALAYGRLGVPAPGPRPAARTLRAYLTAEDGSGLADRTALGFLSAYTVPAERPAPRGASHVAPVALGLPADVGSIDLAAAMTTDGATLRNARGVCLARYRTREARLEFSLDDACALEQVAVLLPEVAAYASAMLDTLFRGSLTLSLEGGALAASAGTTALGAGTVIVLWDDASGVRTEYARLEVQGAAAGAGLGRLASPPAGATRVSVLFRGVDGDGEALSATGSLAVH